jgi:hypothetical protein
MMGYYLAEAAESHRTGLLREAERRRRTRAARDGSGAGRRHRPAWFAGRPWRLPAPPRPAGSPVNVPARVPASALESVPATVPVPRREAAAPVVPVPAQGGECRPAVR